MSALISLFLKGLVIGLSIAAPIGPIGILCIRTTLSQGALVGLFAWLGAATADALYGLIAVFGMTFTSNFLIQQQVPLSIIGGIFLGYLGIKTFLAQPTEKVQLPNSASLFKSYVTTLILTLTNPMTILAFIAIFSGIGAANASDSYGSAMALISGVFLGSIVWWATFYALANYLRQQITEQTINKVSGIMLTIFAILIIASLLN